MPEAYLYNSRISHELRSDIAVYDLLLSRTSIIATTSVRVGGCPITSEFILMFLFNVFDLLKLQNTHWIIWLFTNFWQRQRNWWTLHNKASYFGMMNGAPFLSQIADVANLQRYIGKGRAAKGKVNGRNISVPGQNLFQASIEIIKHLFPEWLSTFLAVDRTLSLTFVSLCSILFVLLVPRILRPSCITRYLWADCKLFG